MNVVDELVVKLGLDSSQFRKGREQVEVELGKTKSAAISTGKEMEAAGENAAQLFAKVKTEALGLIGVLVGSAGLGAFIKDQTTSLAALGRAATNIGVGARDLSAFQMMIERQGGSAQAATASLQGYANAIERFKVFGDTSILGFLNPIGASVSDDPLAVVAKFQKYIEENINKPGGAQLINLEGRGLGYDQDLINSLIQVRTLANEQRELAKSYELGVPTREQIDRATQLQKDWGGLTQASESLARSVTFSLSPAMSGLLEWYTKEVQQEPAVAAGLAVVAGYLTVMAGLNFSSLLTMFTRLFPILSLLALTGPAGGGGPGGTQQQQLDQDELLAEQWKRAHGGSNASAGPISSFLQTLSAPESGGRYGAIGGSTGTLPSLAQFPSAPGHYGRYQFSNDTWAEEARKLGLTDFSAASQDRAAWDLASAEYAKKTGRSLSDDLKAGGHDQEIAGALQGRWPSVPGGSQSRLPRSAADYSKSVGPPIAGPAAIDPALNIPPSGAASSTSSTSSTSVTVGDIHITGVKDGADAARQVQQALTDSWIVQAGRGIA